jgi:hypothetical protein
MWVRVSLAVFVMAVITMPASAAVRITGDKGGQIGPYLDNFVALRSTGQRVIIDGPCLSACTLVTAVMPRSHICVTPRASLGFHAAWAPNEAGRKTVHRTGTKLVYKIYPKQIRSWIARNGGLGDRMIYLSGRQLASIYPRCE